MTTDKEKPFDPFAYAKDRRDNPENYVSMKSIVEDAKALHRVGACRTIDELKRVFQETSKAAKDNGDDQLLQWLIEAKDKRKEFLVNG